MPRKQLKGKIKSISGVKTVVVEVTRFYHHPLYRKRLSKSKRYLAHVNSEVLPGQEVTMEEVRPMSARKRWKITSVEGKQIEKVNEVKKVNEESRSGRLKAVKSPSKEDKKEKQKKVRKAK